jgi:MoaA/NifB/PqqE/SkfB family radical SAM enzyme
MSAPASLAAPIPAAEACRLFTFVVSPRCLRDGSWRQIIAAYGEGFAAGAAVDLALLRRDDDDPRQIIAGIAAALRPTGRRADRVGTISLHRAPEDEAGWAELFAEARVFVPARDPADAELVRIARGRGLDVALTPTAVNLRALFAATDPDRVCCQPAADGAGRVLVLDPGTKAKLDLQRAPAFPVDIQLEMSSRCNARCLMCPVTVSLPGILIDYALFERVVAQCEGQPELQRFWFHLYGETLLHRRIVDAWRHARARLPGVALGTYSNGSLMDEEKARAALANLDTLVFSIDGATRATFAAIRKGLDFDQVVTNVLRTIELRAELGTATVICVNMTETAENRHEREQFLEFWRAQGVYANVYAEMAKVGGRGVEPVRSVTPCYSPFTNLVVFSDGLVVPCCDDAYRMSPVGDVRRQTIAEIWNGPEYAAYRARHLVGGKFDIAACAACDNNRWRLVEGFF